MKIDDLPEVDEGDWGLVLADVDGDGQWKLMYYDDDEFECCFLAEKSTEEDDENSWCHPECENNYFAVCYPLFERGGYYMLSHWSLKKLPCEDLTPPCDGEGYVYVIATIPDITLGRLKIGWTKNLQARMQQYKTANPTALLLALWGARPLDESRAHELAGRMVGVTRSGKSEVFDCKDPFEVISGINNLFSKEFVDGSP